MESPFVNPSAAGFQVPDRPARPPDGGLSVKPSAVRRRLARARGEGGGVAGVGDGRRDATASTTAALLCGASSSTAGVEDGRRRGAMESATAALVKLLTPESTVKVGASVGTDR